VIEHGTFWLLAISLALGFAAAAWRARRWAIGRPAPVEPWRLLARFPRSYFGDVHEIVARDVYAARMHIMVAGGFSAAIALILVVHLAGVDAPALAWALVAALAVMLGGAVAVARRRLFGRPARLSAGIRTVASCAPEPARPLRPRGPSPPWPVRATAGACPARLPPRVKGSDQAT